MVQGRPGSVRPASFQLLLVCAELVRPPVTTIGLLAQALTSEAGFDAGRYGDRSSFVDALLVLGGWGVVRATAGTLEAFPERRAANAILAADAARLHRLLVSASCPRPDRGHGRPVDAVALLLAEPRYGTRPRIRYRPRGAAAAVDPAQHRPPRLRRPGGASGRSGRGRHDYLLRPSGRASLRQRAVKAGFELEERAEGVLAVNPEAVTTDLPVSAPVSNAYQARPAPHRPTRSP